MQRITRIFDMIYTKIFGMIVFLDNFDVNLFDGLCVNRFVSS